jgi:hypothetical protein
MVSDGLPALVHYVQIHLFQEVLLSFGTALARGAVAGRAPSAAGL